VADHLYDPVKRCIYCGVEVLPPGVRRFTDEHIIPGALGGNLVLQEASCKKCQSIINTQFERPILLKEWGYLRIKRNFPIRNHRKRKGAAPTRVELTRKNGQRFFISPVDYSCPVPLYKFKTARIFTGQPRINDNLQWSADILTDHEEEKAMINRFPEWDGCHAILSRPYEFARLIAKISHSYCVAELGFDAFTPWLTEIIRNLSDDYFQFIGGSFDSQDAIPGGDHVTNISFRVLTPLTLMVVADVRLFSQIRTPAYHAAVGLIDLQNPIHVSMFEKHRLNGKIPNLPPGIG
jgi:HNH endonuclease